MKQHNLKNVLMLICEVPPKIGAGVLRSLKFVKYLPEFGWRPIVLTYDDPGAPKGDYDLVKEIPAETVVVETPSYVPRIFSGYTWREESKFENAKPNIIRAIANPLIKAGVVGLRKWIFIPDRARFWKNLALQYTNQLVKEHSIDAMFSTSPPQGLHLVARAIKKKYNFPWVADFRDHWIDNQYNKYLSEGGVRLKYERYLEHKVISAADAVISASQTATENFQARYPAMARKFFTVPNGADAEDFNKIPPMAHPGHEDTYFKVRCVGSVAWHADPSPLLAAFKKLRETEAFQNIKLEFIGRFAHPKDMWYEILGTNVVFRDSVSHERAIYEMQTADLLVVIYAKGCGEEFSIPSKIYEYAFSGTPILGVISDGAAKRIIEQYKLGKTADWENAKKIAEAILFFYEQWRAKKRWGNPPTEFLEKYNRRSLTRMLANTLDEISRSRAAKCYN